MSVATELAPIVFIPPRARQKPPPVATVSWLHRPSRAAVAAPLRLTGRGVLALATGVALLGAALVLLAWRSAPAAPVSRSIPAVVTVQSGDTLWSIASQAAPDRDPRAEVAELQRLNRLGGSGLVVGQDLRTR
jgi:Tfp pilus assembly protein FimV